MRQVNVIVVGAGHLGKIHVKLLHDHPKTLNSPSVRCVGIVEPNPSSAEAMAKQWNVPVFSELSACNVRFDAAIIATPTQNHFDVAHKLLSLGKHVLIEKPITCTTTESQTLIELAKTRNLVIQVGHVERFNPAFQAARDSIENPRYMELRRASRFTGRSTDIGVVMDLMIHDIDLMLNVAQSRVARVDALGISVFGDHEDLAQARITFANGTVANLWASRCSFAPQRTLHLVGTNGYCHADLTSREIVGVTVPEEVQSKRVIFNRLSPEAKARLTENLFDEVLPQKSYEVPPANPLLEEQADFCRAVLGMGQNQVTAADGQAALEVAQQVLSSIRSHTWTEHPFGPRGALVGIDQMIAFQNPETMSLSRRAG